MIQYTSSGAIISPDGKYRYHLWRRWGYVGKRVLFIMLNPSTADGSADDATIRRCVGFAKAWGFAGLDVVNLFAYRTVSPRVLRDASRAQVVGLRNDRFIRERARIAAQVVVSWGAHGSYLHRDAIVLDMLAEIAPVYALGVTMRGQPKHPLYLARYTEPFPFNGTFHDGK